MSCKSSIHQFEDFIELIVRSDDKIKIITNHLVDAILAFDHERSSDEVLSHFDTFLYDAKGYDELIILANENREIIIDNVISCIVEDD